LVARSLNVSKRWAERYVLAGLERSEVPDPSWVEFRQKLTQELLSEEAEKLLGEAGKA
jgi:hypothetical protein